MIDFIDNDDVNEWFWEDARRSVCIRQDEDGNFEARVYIEAVMDDREGIGTGPTYEEAIQEAVLDYKSQLGV